MMCPDVLRGARRSVAPLLALAGLAACTPARAEAPVRPSTPAAARPVTISVLATNDVHGRLSQLPLFGGYAANLRAARAADGGGVLLIDAGDIFQGTLASCLTEGAAMIRGYAALGYSAAALGNHEFDFGPVGPAPIPRTAEEDPFGALRERIRQAPFPILCSNLTARDGSASPLPELPPSVEKTVAGVHVGIIGGLTEHALSATHSANVTSLAMAPLGASIAREARILRTRGARVVIATVHAGGECLKLDDPNDISSCDPGAEIFDLARDLAAASGTGPPLVDLILGGHTHARVAHRVAGIAIIESGANGHAFGRADISVNPDARAQPVVRIYPPHELCEDRLDGPTCTSELYEGRPVERDAKVLAAISGDLDHAASRAAEPIGVQVTSPLSRSSQVESPLTNLVVDLMLKAVPGAQAAFNNPGSVRIPLPNGPLTYGRVFEVFPFENRFARLRMRASDLAKVVQNSLESDRGLVTLAGVRAIAHCKGGNLTVRMTDAKGNPLPAKRKLLVVTSDYVAASGDGLMRNINLPASAVSIMPEPFIRDALIDGLKAVPGGKLDGSDRRIYDPQRPRLKFEGQRPLRCK